MRALLLGAFAPLLVGTMAHAETRHVAVTGADTNPGTAASPWRTIQRAATAVVPGDTVIIHAGTYVGFRVTAQGTQAAPIAFVGDGVVQIDGAATTNRDAVLVEGGAWIRIEGLTVTGATRSGIAALDCSHITVRGNRADSNGKWGVFSSFCDDLVVEANELSRSGTQHGVYASNSADRPVIRKNRIWGNAMCGVHMNGDINFGGDGVISNAIVEDNVIYNNGALGGSAINGDGIVGAVIRNNVLDGNHASGISLYRIDGGAPSTGNQLINNTVRMAADARWAVNIQDGSNGNVLRNNVLLHASPSRGAIDACATCTSGMISDHNAVVGRFLIGGQTVDLAGWRAQTGKDAASFVATAAQLFTNPATGDLTLRDGSPAIDQGVTDGAPPADVLGTLRPQAGAIDIGAYEHCTGPCTGGEPDPGDGTDPGDGMDPGDGGDPGDGDEPGDGDQPDDGMQPPPGDEGDGDPFVGPPAAEPAAGCSVGHSRDAGWLVLALGALLARRRRR